MVDFDLWVFLLLISLRLFFLYFDFIHALQKYGACSLFLMDGLNFLPQC